LDNEDNSVTKDQEKIAYYRGTIIQLIFTKLLMVVGEK
jgi:hypothetical protein